MTESTPPAKARGLRPEIQLLRAVAVLSVVGNHLSPNRIHGGYLGVDIFFVISGYLITAHLLRELERSGRIRLGQFWARRARRLLPASLTVLGVCVIGTLAFVPAEMWRLVMRQIAGSALYVQNWLLAHDAEDYFASSNSPSPVTHYWSLSLEEQFYLVWPVVALAAYAIGRRRWGNRGGRVGLTIVFTLIVAASFGYSIWETARLPHAAYFVTPTRMWQLGVGGLFALLPAPRRRPVLALAGWAAVAVSLAVFTESTPVPGWRAALPVLGTALVIYGGDAFLRDPVAPARGPIRLGLWIGGISYSLYLWHWPLIVLLPYVSGHALTPATKVGILLASILLAYLSARFIEDPVRRMRLLSAGRLWRTFVPALAAMTVVVMAAQLSVQRVDHRIQTVSAEVTAEAQSTDPCFGARAVANGCAHPHTLRYKDAPLLSMTDYFGSAPQWGQGCQQTPTGTDVMECQFGVPLAQAKMRIAVVGDSHVHHWTSALDVLAREHHWNVVMMAKSSCTVNAEPVVAAWDSTIAQSCHEWSAKVIRKVTTDPSIDAVITSAISRRYLVPGATDQVAAQVDGYLKVWRQWVKAGKRVIGISDVPSMANGDIPTCVAMAHTDVDPCTTPSKVALRADPLFKATQQADDPHISGVNLRRYFCDHGRCHSVIGGVVAYGDSSHLLAFFAQTLAPYIDEQLPAALH